MKKLNQVILLVTLVFINWLSSAQDFPNKPIQIIVGSGADQIARLLSERMSDVWSQPVIVEQRLAAGGMIAGDTVAKSTPDGSTILLSSSAYPILQALRPKMPFNYFEDLKPVIMFTKSTFVLVINQQIPVNNFTDLIQLARQRSLNFGSVGVGTTSHIGGEMLNQQANIKLTHIPYKNFPSAITDLIGGQIQMVFAPLSSVLPLIKDGKLKPLGVSTDIRDQYIPTVPTFTELGYPNINFIGWNGFHVSSKTPEKTVQRIFTDIAKIINTPEFRKKAELAGYQLTVMDSKEFGDFQAKDFNRVNSIIKDAQIKID
jgi:tripartite-type tricarboxylate transporter receptor subunit TctC